MLLLLDELLLLLFSFTKLSLERVVVVLCEFLFWLFFSFKDEAVAAPLGTLFVLFATRDEFDCNLEFLFDLLAFEFCLSSVCFLDEVLDEDDDGVEDARADGADVVVLLTAPL